MGSNVRVQAGGIAIDHARALLDIRDKLLRDAGFRDIEYRDGSLKLHLPQPGRHDLGSRRVRRHDPRKPRHESNGDGEQAERRDTWDVNGRQPWALTFRADKLLAASWRYPWKNRKHRQICRMLGEGATWRAIAAKTACSFKTVAMVTRVVRDWEDPEDAE